MPASDWNMEVLESGKTIKDSLAVAAMADRESYEKASNTKNGYTRISAQALLNYLLENGGKNDEWYFGLDHRVIQGA